MDDLILRWIVELVRASRELEQVALGASVRASLALERTARAWALIARARVRQPDDVETLFLPVLGHRDRLHADIPRRGAAARPRRRVRELPRPVPRARPAARAGRGARAARPRRRPRSAVRRNMQPLLERHDPALSAPAAPRLGVRRLHEHPARAGLGRRRLAALPAGRPHPRDRLEGVGAASSARGSDEFIVRERFAEEMPRVVLVCDRRPEMALFPPELPWLHKPEATAWTVRVIVASAINQRALVGYLDYAGHDASSAGQPFWRSPRSQASGWHGDLVEAVVGYSEGERDAPADNVERGAALPRPPPRLRPAGQLRLRALRLPRDVRRRTRGARSRAGAGTSCRWSSRTRSGSTASRRSAASRRPSPTWAATACSRSASRPARPTICGAPRGAAGRVARVVREVGLDHVDVSSADPVDIHAAFIGGRRGAWSTEDVSDAARTCRGRPRARRCRRAGDGGARRAHSRRRKPLVEGRRRDVYAAGDRRGDPPRSTERAVRRPRRGDGAHRCRRASRRPALVVLDPSFKPSRRSRRASRGGVGKAPRSGSVRPAVCDRRVRPRDGARAAGRQPPHRADHPPERDRPRPH